MSFTKSVILASVASVALVGALPQTTTPPAYSGSSSSTTTCDTTLCEDFTNPCGLTYGGCFPACSGYTTPVYYPPPCPVNPTATTTNAPATCTVCADYINSCGSTYGGCYNSCKTPSPTFVDPGCATTTPTTTPITTPTTSCGTRCVDYINSCGQTYGGCFNECASTTPSFTDPGCPTTTDAGCPAPTAY